MEIKKVANGSISGFESKNIETTKNAPQSPTLGVGATVSTFENVGVQTGSKDLGLDQSKLAGNINIDNPPTGTQTTDNRSKYENRPGNPFSKGDDKSSDPIADRKNGAADPSGPTGPDYASIINQGMNREIPSIGDQYAQYGGTGRTKEEMRERASGQFPDSSQNQNQQTKYGRDGVAQSGGLGYGNVVGYDDSEGAKGGSNDAVKNNPGLNQAVVQTYVNGGAGSNREWALKMSEDDANPNDYTRSDGTRVQTGKDGTVVQTAKDGTKTVTKPDGSSTTIRPDGSYTDKDASGKETGKGDSLTNVDQEYISPEQKMAFLNLSPGAIRPRAGSNGGDIDFAEDALPKGAPLDTSYLERTALRNVGQPANPEGSYGGHPIGSSPNSGGDIDHGPDSDETGYSGTTRGGDPTDINVTVGGAPIKSSEEKSEDDKKTKSKQAYIFRG